MLSKIRELLPVSEHYKMTPQLKADCLPSCKRVKANNKIDSQFLKVLDKAAEERTKVFSDLERSAFDIINKSVYPLDYFVDPDIVSFSYEADEWELLLEMMDLQINLP